MTASFGQILRRLRLATLVPGRRVENGPISWRALKPLSMQGLARRAGIDPSYVHGIEHGTRRRVRIEIVQRIAAGLDLDALDTALLLVAAGHWPWPELGPEDTALALGVLLAIAEGDWRPLDAVSICQRAGVRAGAMMEPR